jgi:ribosome-binding protein aMBF1 (putative translation factor)
LKSLTLREVYVAGNWKMRACIFAMVMACVEPASAAGAPIPSARENRGVAERIGEAAENVGKKIEKTVTGIVKKLEEPRVGERLGETIKNAARKTGVELERLGKKIEDKFSK